MPATTSSLTALALAPGALNTGTPIFESSFTGMLLTPAPARPTARRFFSNFMPCMSAERTRITSGAFDSLTSSKRSGGRRFRPTCAIGLSASTSSFLPPLATARPEVLHVVDELAHALDRHGVVDGGAHAAHGAVPLQLHHALALGALEELLVQLRIGERERHVHPGAVLPGDRVLVERARVEEVVKHLRLGDVALLDLGEPALRFQPLE